MVGAVLLWIGVVFSVAGVIGLLRFPDVFSRIHAAGKVATLGLVFLLLGAVCFMPQLGFKALILAAFVFLTSPAASHAIAIAAHRTYGRIPYGSRDDLADARSALPPSDEVGV